jgi:hypothetical protein
MMFGISSSVTPTSYHSAEHRAMKRSVMSAPVRKACCSPCDAEPLEFILFREVHANYRANDLDTKRACGRALSAIDESH